MQIAGRLMAAIDAYRNYGKDELIARDAEKKRLALLGSLYAGTWTEDQRWPWGNLAEIYYWNSRQIVNMTSEIVGTYERYVWIGDLSTDGKPLPDGTRGAIPIDPQTGSDADNEALLRAFHQNFTLWHWRMWMSVIPKTAAIFGHVLVELVDDYERGLVTPNIVSPWDVVLSDLELNEAGDVKRYALEFPVKVTQSTAFGKPVQADSYVFRKEVDKEAFRYYRDGKPAAFPDLGIDQPVHENPYGFVPAVWFRHEIEVGSKRGIGAYEKAVLPALDLNSTLSSATDYQRKQFGFPIGVIGSALRPGKKITLPRGGSIAPATTAEEVRAAKRSAAEEMHFLPLAEGGQFVTAQFDVGQTMEMVEFVYDRLVAQNPEAELANKLQEVSQATGPGVRWLLAPIVGKVEMARKNHDDRMIALCQMGTAMMGYRVKSGDIPPDILAARPDRYKAFEPYDLDSFGQGKLDATIPLRPVFEELPADKALWVPMADSVQSAWAKRQFGVPEEEIAAQMAEADRLRREQAAAFSLAASGQGDGEPGAEDDEA